MYAQKNEQSKYYIFNTRRIKTSNGWDFMFKQCGSYSNLLKGNIALLAKSKFLYSTAPIKKGTLLPNVI